LGAGSVFADAKEKHAMRYTQLHGLQKVKMQVTLNFSCMNLKKIAMWKRRKGLLAPFSPHFWLEKIQFFGFWSNSLKNGILRFA